jgi:hypothetical protein
MAQKAKKRPRAMPPKTIRPHEASGKIIFAKTGPITQKHATTT